VTNPNTVSSAKRIIGRSHEDASTEPHLPFEITPSTRGDAHIKLPNGRVIAPEAVGAEVLRDLKEAAEDYLGHPVTQAVVTVPAYFNDAQRQATKDAGRIAGLDVKRIITEPTAAAMAFGLNSRDDAKIALSSSTETTISIPFLHVLNNKPINVDMKLTRTRFESIIKDLIERTMVPVKKALKDANLTVDDIDEVLMVGGSTRIPLVQATVKNFFKKDPNKTVNPDQVVALGAATQGGVLTGKVGGILLMDVTPLSLGLVLADGRAKVMIPRNTTIPATKEHTFTNAEDNQTSVDVTVCQGERKLGKDNKILGEFRLDGITPLPRGSAKVTICLAIDADGMLTVTAVDKLTKREMSVKVEATGGMTQAEIDKAIADAIQHKAADEAREAALVARHTLEQKAGPLRAMIDNRPEGAMSEAQLAAFESLYTECTEAVEHDLDEDNAPDYVALCRKYDDLVLEYTNGLAKTAEDKPGDDEDSVTAAVEVQVPEIEEEEPMDNDDEEGEDIDDSDGV
jgi:molecular chaperone DnaK